MLHITEFHRACSQNDHLRRAHEESPSRLNTPFSLQMSHLYELFSKQVARFCADSSRPDCNKNLLVSGVRNLADMNDNVLDKLDPYQRGAKDISKEVSLMRERERNHAEEIGIVCATEKERKEKEQIITRIPALKRLDLVLKRLSRLQFGAPWWEAADSRRESATSRPTNPTSRPICRVGINAEPRGILLYSRGHLAETRWSAGRERRSTFLGADDGLSGAKAPRAMAFTFSLWPISIHAYANDASTRDESRAPHSVYYTPAFSRDFRSQPADR